MPTIRADFSRLEWVRPEDFQWTTSPGGEVERVMLDRVGDEVAVATSLVRYPAGSRFPAHEHGLGEEYLVLEGEFADEHGRYGPGTYVRNPPGSRHAPFSDPGCVIWVKLRQFHPHDTRQMMAELTEPLPEAGSAARELHRFEDEVVTEMTGASNARLAVAASASIQEVLVIDGSVDWRDQRLERWSWLRVPPGEGLDLAVAEPCRLLHKTRPPFAVPRATSATSAASAGT